MADKLMTDREIIRALRTISSWKRGHRGDWSMSAVAAQAGLRRQTLYDVCNGMIMTDRIRRVLSAVLRDVDIEGEIQKAVRSGAGYMSVR